MLKNITLNTLVNGIYAGKPSAKKEQHKQADGDISYPDGCVKPSYGVCYVETLQTPKLPSHANPYETKYRKILWSTNIILYLWDYVC